MRHEDLLGRAIDFDAHITREEDHLDVETCEDDGGGIWVNYDPKAAAERKAQLHAVLDEDNGSPSDKLRLAMLERRVHQAEARVAKLELWLSRDGYIANPLTAEDGMVQPITYHDEWPNLGRAK